MEEVDNRVNPLSDDQIADIEQGWFVQSAKEALEAKLAGHKANKYRAMYSIIRYYKNDTLNPASQDSIIKVLKNENRQWAKYDLSFYYLNANDTLNSDNVMDSIPILFDLTTAELNQYNLYSDYYDIVRELKIQGKSIIQIDSSQKQTLYSIYNNARGGLKAYVRNALIVADTLTYNEPYIFPNSLKSGKIRRIPVRKIYTENNFKLYPNPAGKYVIIEYSVKEENFNAFIQIIDNSGKIIKSLSLQENHAYQVIPLNDLPNGIYICKFVINNKIIEAEKLIITH